MPSQHIINRVQSLNLDRETRKAIGLRIRRARKARGWSLQDLADITGAARMTVACWECGAFHPSTLMLWRVSAALRRGIGFLLAGEGERATRERRNDMQARQSAENLERFRAAGCAGRTDEKRAV